MKFKLSIITLLTLGLFFLIATPALAENLNNPFPMPGRIQGTGTFFEIKDSQYLNVSLESNQEIKIILESVPKMIILDVVAAEDNVGPVTLILKGLQSNTTYYQYQNSYKNEAVFIADESGNFSWSQDLSESLHIWIQEQESTTYIEEDTTLDSDITGSVEISVSGVTLDCNGHNITGNGTGYGIYLYDKMNVTIKNCNVSNFYYGIQIGGTGASYNSIVKNNTFNNVCGISIRGYWWQQSSNNYIFENQIHSNLYQGMELYGTNANQLIGNSIFNNDQMGLLLNWAPSNYLRNNTITNNDYNFGASGGWVSGAQDIDTSNTVNGRPIYYLVNEKDRTIDASLNPGYVGVVNSENITIRDITISNNIQGIYLESTTHSRIENTHLTNNLMGIEMNLCSENEIIGNELSQNSWNGARLWVSSYTIFIDNDISNNGIGIELTAYLGAYSHNNKIYHNNFKNNQVQITADRNYDDLFDDGYPSGGNYYSDYTGIDEKSGPNQDQPGSDGIGDTPYTFYYMSQDRYPFMKENGWELVNQPPVFTNLNQYKSDAIIQINEGQTTTESTVVFKAIVSDPDNDRVKLQVELKEFDQDFNQQNLIESDFVDSGTQATRTRYGLVNGQYKWRARAVDEKGATSDWHEFGRMGNVDFEVKLLPLYTQVQSPYPSRDETDSWFREQYGNGGIGGYAEYRITLNNTDNYILIVNGKDDEAVDSKTGKKITAKVGACLYKIKDKYGDPICIAEKMLSWSLGDNQYKSVSAVLGRVISGSYFFRLTSKEDYFDLNNPDESGNLNVYLDWFEFRNATSSLLRQEAENDVTFKGGEKTSDSGKMVIKIDGYSCGRFIADCGCAMVSMVMLGRFYDINNGINNSGVNPYFMNDWLRKNDGYNKLGNLVWGKGKEIGAITYLSFKDSENITNVRLSLDVYNATTTSPVIDQYINSAKPTVVRSDKFGHYFVMDGKLASTYTIKDPFWYNTKTLNDNRIGEHIQNYRGKINVANLFSYLSTPRKILSYSKSTSIYVASPVELLITDPQGRRLGKDPTTGMEYNEIPDATYTYETPPVSEEPLESEEAPKIKVVDIPDTIDGKYDIKVFGLRAGSYTLEFFTNDTSGKVKDETISGSIDADIVQDFEFNYFSQSVEETQLQQIVPIDIKPDSFPNSVNCKNNKEIIPVAILTTPLFDATAVDADTVRFGPAGAQETHRDKKTGKAQRHVEDVDKDGDLDLVFHFRFGDMGMQCGDEKATLTGLTIDGHNIMGTDTIRTVKASVARPFFSAVSSLSASIIELPFQFFKSLAAKFAQWLGFLYEYFFPPEPMPSTQSEKIIREPCLKEDEGVWVIPRYWSYTYSYRSNKEFVDPLTVYVYSEGVIPKEDVSEDEADRRVIEKNNFYFTISGVPESGDPPKIRKCGIYVDKLFKDQPKRYEAWKYDYSGKGERIMVLDAFDEHGTSIKESSNADYSPLFKIDETETYIALVRSWYGEPEKHALVIKDLKTLEDVYVITIKELMGRYRIGLGTIQLSDARERFVLFEVLNNENPWFGLNIDTGELERTDILP